jgi:nucleoid DNA-binding protein
MNKSDLVDKIAESLSIPKLKASQAVDVLVDSIKQALAEDDTVTLIGFGTFSVRARAARTGRNPRTGDPIDIKKAKVPVFKPGKSLKDALNQ